jgi:hypothetical protein
MRLILFSFWLMILPAIAGATTISFQNDREGKSYYSSKKNDRLINQALKAVDERQILGAFSDILRNTEKNKLCSFDINESLQTELKKINPKFNQLEGAIHFLRSENEIDDTVVKILLTANQVLETDPMLPKNPERLFLPNKAQVPEMIKLISTFESKYLKNSCFDEAFRNLYSDVQKLDKKFQSHNLEALLVEAYQQKKISHGTYLSLEKARLSELELTSLTLKTYYQKISSLRVQYPLRDANERSDFSTQKVDKMKVSRRQHLLSSYSDLQIIMMGNVIKKLRARLESPKAEILIYDRAQGVETITLEPMERFRLAIKLLRKEMSYLSLNTYFAGRSPDYMDLMTAAYEIGIIPASELEEVAGLKEIWSPKKTFWDKARVWVQTLSTVATIVIPPPYGFIPALAVVIIEATAGKQTNTNLDDPTSLF